MIQKDVKIKQYLKMKRYLGCVQDVYLARGFTSMQLCSKITSKLKFLCRKAGSCRKSGGDFMQHSYSTTLRPGMCGQVSRCKQDIHCFCNQLNLKDFYTRNAIGNANAKFYCKTKFLHNSNGGWNVFWNYFVNIQKKVCESTFLSFVLA